LTGGLDARVGPPLPARRHAEPLLSERIVPLPLSDADVDALVAFMNALDGEGCADVPPPSFPR